MTIKSCPTCGGEGEELPFATDIIACKNTMCPMGGGVRREAWDRLSYNETLRNAVETLSETVMCGGGEYWIITNGYKGGSLVDRLIELASELKERQQNGNA